MSQETHVVTGAFSYSGKYIKELLLNKGIKVKTLTSKKVSSSERGDVEVMPYRFDNIDELARSFEGADVLYNTYWVRFNHGDRSYTQAVENTKSLIKAAVMAGVRRIVHVSITNPSKTSPLPYFKGKAILEQEIMDSGLSYAILRPTVLFGKEDILINNIAWLLRKLPIFGVFGNGRYKIQPVFVGDLATLAVEKGSISDNTILDAVGPEIFTFRHLVNLIREAVESRALIVNAPRAVVLSTGRVLGLILGDVVITEDEIEGLGADLLISSERPTCPTRFSDWLKENKNLLGIKYSSELWRHYS